MNISSQVIRGALALSALGAGVAAAGQFGCSSVSQEVGGSNADASFVATPPSADTTGSLGLALTLPGGAQLTSVTYTLTASGGGLVTLLGGGANPGTISVANSQGVSFLLGGVPAATGDAIALSASLTNGGSCQGSTAGFNVVAGQTSNVQVQMLCSLPGADAGNLAINATTSYCGTWTGLSTNGSEAYVGESVVITATATGPDPNNLGYTWTMSNPIGVFGAIQPDGGVGSPGRDVAAGPSDPMQFLCTSAGTTTVTVGVDDGAIPDGGACSGALSSISTTITCDASPTNRVESAWVEIGSGNTVIARAVTSSLGSGDGGAPVCPTIAVNGGTPQSMNLRAAAATNLPLRTVTTNPGKPSIFPVSSCELTLPAGTTSAVVAGQSLPLPKANPTRVVVLGDTGCRLQVGNGLQACNDPTQYPFSTIATLAAAQHPDLVLHVGDYEYRESECPAGMSSSNGCGGSPWGYGWDSWQADFFSPGAPLLAAAPWIMVRGNHEMCNRSGQGWYRFLDTNAYDPVTKNCNSAANDALATGGNYNDPYLVSINSSTQLVVFDTTNIPKTVPAVGSLAYMTYQSELMAAGNLVASPPAGVSFNWWANHHPILGFATATPYTTAAPGFAPIMNAVFPNTYFPPNINLALHGHVHDFQAINFAPAAGYSNAATLVSGNAGDIIDQALPATLASPDPGVTIASEGDAGPGSAIANSAAFGYMVLDYQSATNTWLATEYRLDNSVRDTCVVQASGQMTCASYGYLP